MNFEPVEIQKLQTVKDELLAQVEILTKGLTKKRDEVLASRKEMWREARRAIRDFDDVADLYVFAEEVSSQEMQYGETSKQLGKLTKMLNEPYFARIDFIEREYGDDIEEIYIGRYSLFDEKTQTFHVYDWRAPISSLYYDHGVGDASYKVPATGAIIKGEIVLKRQYQIEKCQLKYLFDNDIAINDEILRMELSKTADASIKTIINTIQTEQNRAIRADDNNMLVYGPAGSGKTSVGLHRLAYLLYRDRNSLTSAKLRIFSPSPVFASYIAGIIPELGEDDVENLDFSTLLEEKTKKKFFGLYQQIEALSINDERTQWLAHKYSPAFLDQLEAYIANHRPSFEDVYFNTDKLCDGGKLQKLYEDRTNASTLKSKTERVLNYVDRAYNEYYKLKNLSITELFNDIHDDNFSDQEVRIKYEEEKSIVMRDLQSRLRPRSLKLYEKFLKNYSGKNPLPRHYIKETLYTEKLLYEDALMLFYIDILTGQTAPDKTVRHILLDEAQDLSHLHHRILARLYPASHYTVLADTNQALYQSISINSIQELTALYPEAVEFPLTKSYRSTYEINTFAAQFLDNPNPSASYTRHGAAPEVIQTPDTIGAVKALLKKLKDYSTVGILLPTTQMAVEFHKALKSKNIQLIATETCEFKPGVMVMAVPFAKGLEFDAVICPNYNSPIFEGEFGRRLMYLICTRALHGLYLVEGV